MIDPFLKQRNEDFSFNIKTSKQVSKLLKSIINFIQM